MPPLLPVTCLMLCPLQVANRGLAHRNVEPGAGFIQLITQSARSHVYLRTSKVCGRPFNAQNGYNRAGTHREEVRWSGEVSQMIAGFIAHNRKDEGQRSTGQLDMNLTFQWLYLWKSDKWIKLLNVGKKKPRICSPVSAARSFIYLNEHFIHVIINRLR